MTRQCAYNQVSCCCTAGERIASSTNVDALFQHNFFLLVNDNRYRVKVAKEGIQKLQLRLFQ